MQVAGNELRAIIGTEIFRLSVLEEQGIESVQDFGMSHLGGNGDTKRLARIFIENSEHLVTSTAAQLVVNEVNTPDMVRILRPQADDGTILVIEPFTPLVAVWQLKTFFPPQAFGLLVIDDPAFDTKKLSNLAVTVAAILLR